MFSNCQNHLTLYHLIDVTCTSTWLKSSVMQILKVNAFSEVIFNVYFSMVLLICLFLRKVWFSTSKTSSTTHPSECFEYHSDFLSFEEFGGCGFLCLIFFSLAYTTSLFLCFFSKYFICQYRIRFTNQRQQDKSIWIYF